jgi:hypothetical protein
LCMNGRLLLATLLASSMIASAGDNTAYSITSDGHGDFNWMNIRKMDISTGTVTNTVFDRFQTRYILTDVISHRSLEQSAVTNEAVFSSKDFPTYARVAAAALDTKTNRLFFTPMKTGELRWLDLNTRGGVPRFYSIESDILKFEENKEGNYLSRMVIGSDGFGYGVTNNGSHLVRFSTDDIPQIVDLGGLIDDPANELSIHETCSGWGGDMFADAFGKLYIISSNRNLFVVDPETRITTYKGSIKGLPAGYTTNGAAVTLADEIVVSSANSFEGFYKLTLDNLTAVKIEGSDKEHNASDLANGNLLFQRRAIVDNKYPVPGSGKIFPNPATSSFYVRLDGQKEGKYTILLSDVAGRTLQSKEVDILAGEHSEQFKLVNSAKGMYIVKVLDNNKQVVLTEKLVVGE